jgi:hypothetical protein
VEFARRHVWPFSLEKWYIDTILDDGTLLIVILGEMHVLGLHRAGVIADLFFPDGHSVHGHSSAAHIEVENGCVTVGETEMSIGHLIWRTDSLRGELYFSPRSPPAALQDPLITGENRALRWVIEVPDADADGSVTWGDTTLAVRGRGYHDFVSTDLLPWQFPVRELHWGRAVLGEHATVWMAVSRTESGPIRGRWTDGRIYDSAEHPHLEDERTLIDRDVADTPGLHLGPARPILRRLVRDPHQRRWIAHVDSDPHRGWAVGEVLTWD